MKELFFHRVPVEIKVNGPLHATSPQNPGGVGHMLARQPAPTILRARQDAGEPVILLPDLAEQVMEEVDVEERSQCAVFRRDPEGRPFLHPNYIKGHLRDAGDALSKLLGFWGLQTFINKTLFVSPERIYLDGEVKVERWPTHFDIYRRGRVSSFREAEYVDDPTVHFTVFLLGDPRWEHKLLQHLFEYGSVRGMGGGRGRYMGQYAFTLGEWTKASAGEVWEE